MDYYFSRTSIALDKKLIEQINSAHQSLDIAIYSLTRDQIVNAILAAKSRGVVVRIICDREQANAKYSLQDILKLQAALIPIKVNIHSGLMHLKTCIIDQTTVTLGSYNYTKSATLENDEILAVVHDPVIANGFLTHFNSMWEDNINYKSF